MATAVIMPKQGQSVETCIITKWFRTRGESVSEGDILFSYETDKAAFDLESPAAGVLLDIFFEEGSEVPVLSNVAVIGRSGETAESFRPDSDSVQKAVVVPAQGQEKTSASSVSAAALPISEQQPSKIRISPRARRLAQVRGIDFSHMKGSGPNGRIVSSDIENPPAGSTGHQAQQAAYVPEFSEQPLSNVRKLISKAMHTSLQNAAQLTHHMSADVRHLLEARRSVKESLISGKTTRDITLNDMICWCVIRALEKFPEANSHFLDDRIKTFHKIHLGFAVDTPRGLMVPVVRNAGEMDLPELSASMKSAADACKKGSISPELLQGVSASFTVSNLGNYGVEMFTPVINLPQVAILGVCTIISRPADLGNNVFGFVPYVGLSLTYDHRAIDGGPATLFLREIREQIEKFRLQG